LRDCVRLTSLSQVWSDSRIGRQVVK
jgi:hypothetical protein